MLYLGSCQSFYCSDGRLTRHRQEMSLRIMYERVICHIQCGPPIPWFWSSRKGREATVQLPPFSPPQTFWSQRQVGQATVQLSPPPPPQTTNYHQTIERSPTRKNSYGCFSWARLPSYRACLFEQILQRKRSFELLAGTVSSRTQTYSV